MIILQWLSGDLAPCEHDLSGLRENFNAKARWKAAIAGARALHRFGSTQSRLSTSSKSSGGWGTDLIDSEDEDEDLVGKGGKRAATDPGENENVKVTAPDEGPVDSPALSTPSNPDSQKEDQGSGDEYHPANSDDDDLPTMPGSFHESEVEGPNSPDTRGTFSQEGWSYIFKKLGRGS